MLTLTLWWKTLVEEIEKLLLKVDDAAFSNDAEVGLIKQFALLGKRFENPDNALLELQHLNDEIKALQQLSLKVTHPEVQQDYYFPALSSANHLLLAILYYNQLCRFKDIESPISIVQNGVSLIGKPGIKQKKPEVAKIAAQYKARILQYIDTHKQTILETFPILATFQGPDFFNNCKQFLISDCSLEEKLAIRLNADFESCLAEAKQQQTGPRYFLN